MLPKLLFPNPRFFGTGDACEDQTMDNQTVSSSEASWA